MNIKDWFEISIPLHNKIDIELFTCVWNQGIDAHLEAFVKSFHSVKRNRLYLYVHVSELQTLVRRLLEQDIDQANEWADNIIYVNYDIQPI